MGLVLMKNKDNYVNTCVGRKIRATRKSIGMTERQLAQLTGLSQQQVSHYETGKATIMADVLVYIAAALNAPISKLLPDRHERPENDVGDKPSEEYSDK